MLSAMTQHTPKGLPATNRPSASHTWGRVVPRMAQATTTRPFSLCHAWHKPQAYQACTVRTDLQSGCTVCQDLQSAFRITNAYIHGEQIANPLEQDPLEQKLLTE